jgi:hypothetical protein
MQDHNCKKRLFWYILLCYNYHMRRIRKLFFNKYIRSILVELLTLKRDSLYIGWFILILTGKYFENMQFYKKTFQIKVVWYRGGRTMVTLVWLWDLRSDEGQPNFFKWKSLFLITFSDWANSSEHLWYLDNFL